MPVVVLKVCLSLFEGVSNRFGPLTFFRTRNMKQALIRIPMQRKSMHCTFIFTIYLFVSSSICHAIEINLKTPVVYRNTTFKRFDTKEVTLVSLLAIAAKLETTDPESKTLIGNAIDHYDFKQLPSVAYVIPPLHYFGKLIYQIAVYQEPETELSSVLQALQEQEPRNYKAIEIIERVLELRKTQTNDAKPKKLLNRKRARSKATPKEQNAEQPADSAQPEDTQWYLALLPLPIIQMPYTITDPGFAELFALW